MIITSIERHAVYHARDTFIFPVAPETLNPLFCPAAGRRSALPSQGCGWMGDRAIGRALSLPNLSTHGVDLLTTTHGNGSRDCENTLKRTTLIALSLGLLAPLAAHAAQDLPTLYQAFEEAGNSSLGMDQLNQTVTFTAVALSVSSNLAGEPLIEAGDDQGNVLARLTSDDEQQAAKLGALEEGATFTASCTLQFSSGTDYLSFGDCTIK